MDSITHLFYGGAIAAAIAPRADRRAALLAGMALNTLPDLDVIALALAGDPIAAMTCHRGLTHSWLVLPVVAWGIWALFRRRGGRVARSPARWWWAILVCLLAHPLLDSFTIYGTQLWWPLPLPPLMWGSLFIVDPLFTLPWVLGFALAMLAGGKRWGSAALAAGIALGVGYLGWSLLAKQLVDRQADRALAAMGLADAPRFSVPMPLNTLLWRVVAMTPSGYVEGFRSLPADRGPMAFTGHPSNVQALRQAAGVPAVARLAWFNHGFMRARVVDGELHLADLRMGNEPDYIFEFAVARDGGDGWQAMPARQLPPPAIDAGMAWRSTWRRIRHQPAGAPTSAAVASEPD